MDQYMAALWQTGLISGICVIVAVAGVVLLKQRFPVKLPEDAQVLCKKAWTAYVGPAFGYLVVLAGVMPLVWTFHQLAAIALAALVTLWWMYRQLVLGSYRLYHDVTGVWVKSGLLPWARGISGVKWRDLDEAVFYPGFIHFILKSHTIHLRHRFTKDSEIMLTHMQRGDRAVATINTLHHEKISSNTLN